MGWEELTARNRDEGSAREHEENMVQAIQRMERRLESLQDEVSLSRREAQASLRGHAAAASAPTSISEEAAPPATAPAVSAPPAAAPSSSSVGQQVIAGTSFPGTMDPDGAARLEAKVDKLQTMLNTVLRERAKKEGEHAQSMVEGFDDQIRRLASTCITPSIP